MTNKNILNNFILYFMVGVFFMFRPVAFGEALTPVAVILSISIFFVFLVSNDVAYVNTVSNQEFTAGVYIMVTYYLYVSSIGIFSGLVNYNFLMKEAVSNFIVAIVWGLILIKSGNSEKFFGVLGCVFSVLGYSSFVTVLFFDVFQMPKILLFGADMSKGYGGIDETSVSLGAVYFPISMAYSEFNGESGMVVRYTCLFREPGVGQAFLMSMFIYEGFTRNRAWVLLGLVSGAVLTYSSLAFFSVGYSIFLYSRFVLNSRTLKTGANILLIASVLLGIFAPDIGLLDKNQTHGASFDARSLSVDRALEKMHENPLGSGPYTSTHGDDDGVNLIALGGQIGVIGIFIQIIVISGYRGVNNFNSFLRFLVAGPVLFAALTSQPIATSPVLILFSFMNFYNFKK